MPNNNPDTAVVRAATTADVALLREIRLAALSDAPDAFLSHYDDFVDLDDEQWRTLVAGWTLPPGSAAFIAIAGDAPNATGIGMCGAFVESDVRVALVAMWVAPSARGTSVAERLLNHVVDFAQELGAGEVAAWVVEDNHRALEFYRKNSFQHDGLRQPYAPDPSKDELLTVRRL